MATKKKTTRAPAKKPTPRKTRARKPVPKKKARAARKPPPAPLDPHFAKALKYCEDVVAGRIPAGRLAIAACKRQLADLERGRAGWEFEFRADLGGRICRLIELLPHIEGPLAGQLIKLEPWQCFILTTVFGWVEKGTNKRRFRRSTVFVPRGNGKSALTSGVGIYGTGADGEGGAQVHSAATTRAQAQIVFGIAQKMLRKAPELRERLGFEVPKNAIVQASSASSFGALSREADNLDGLNTHLALVDEIHAHKTREIYDVIETSTGKRQRSLLWVISTAGFDSSGIGFEVYTDAKKVLLGEATDEALFAAIWEADPEDDWTLESTWRKANPNWGISVMPDVIAQLAAKAMRTASAVSGFVTKHLNRWTTADQSAFDIRAWDKCADEHLTPSELTAADAFVGVDLASKIDIAAKVLLFRRDEEKAPQPPSHSTVAEVGRVLGAPPEPLDEFAEQPPAAAEQQKHATEPHYYLFLSAYLPEDAVTDGRNASYHGWELDGHLTTTAGDVLDFAAVRSDILEDVAAYRVLEVAYDPWQATQLAQELEAQGILTVEVRPNVQNFSPAMQELDAAMRSGRLHHDGNPVLRWMVANTVCHRDAKDNVYPRKLKPENKIDGVVAALMALGRAMLAETGSPYETRGVRTLG
jgi:phage terminase large subunit-like protein